MVIYYFEGDEGFCKTLFHLFTGMMRFAGTAPLLSSSSNRKGAAVPPLPPGLPLMIMPIF
jgi:hypothetical protein